MVRTNEKKAKCKENILTDDEKKQLLATAKKPEEILLIYGLLYTGMRINEFVHFKKEWMTDKFIIIPEKQPCKCYECKKEGAWTPKTKSSIRKIPLLPEAKELFIEYFKNYNSINEVIQNRVNAWRILRRIGKKAKILHKVHPHCLRATFATTLAEKDFNGFEITGILGWSSFDTANEYIKLTGKAILKAVEDKW